MKSNFVQFIFRRRQCCKNSLPNFRDIESMVGTAQDFITNVEMFDGCSLQRYTRMSKVEEKSFSPAVHMCDCVCQRVEYFLMIFTSSSAPSPSGVHDPLLTDGLNSERVCDKRVKHSSLAFFLRIYKQARRLFNPCNIRRGKMIFSELLQLHFYFRMAEISFAGERCKTVLTRGNILRNK